PVYLANAPDGSMCIADFYEHYIAHGQHYQSQIDPTTGRLYRLRGADQPRVKDVRRDDKTPEALLAALTQSTRWHRLMAARVLAERVGPDLIARLKTRILADDAPIAALWALHQAGGFDEALAARLIDHPSALIREWSVRLIGDARNLGGPLFEAWLQRIPRETEVRVRAQMAASARRLPAGRALPLVAALAAHDEDVADPCVPLLCWWVLETHWPAARSAILDLWKSDAFWKHPLAREALLPRVMRRCAAEGRRQDLLEAATLLERAPDPASVTALMAGFEEAFRGRDASALPEALVRALARRGQASLGLRLRQRDAAALPEALDRLRNQKAPVVEKTDLVKTLVEVRAPGLRNTLLELLQDQPTPVRQAALSGLGLEDDPALAMSALRLLPGASSELRNSVLGFLASRPAWSLAFLDAVDRGEVDRASIPPEWVVRLGRSPEPAIRRRAANTWPSMAKSGSDSGSDSGSAPNPEVGARIRQLEAVLRKAPGNPYAGESLFQQRCAACHRLFFKGGSVGPDLTSYQRDHLGTLLTSILDPSAEIREGYAAVEVETRDGRTLAGFLTERDERVTTLRGLDGQDQMLPAAEVLSVRPTGRSLMPEGLLDGLSEGQLRDFFAFLRSSQPFTR
ncbi:MAG: hypothetical protein RLZZ34_112, partial [Verrucomicrobiota bacterium]